VKSCSLIDYLIKETSKRICKK